MWKPESTPENTWTLKSSKPILKRMSEPEYFFRTLLYVKKIGLDGYKNICNSYSDMFIIPTDFEDNISLSENDTIESDVGREMYVTDEFSTSIPYVSKKGQNKISSQKISIIERNGIYEYLLECSNNTNQLSVVNIHLVWFNMIKGSKVNFRRQSHSNMLVFDHSTRKIYLFDPYGMTYSSKLHIVYHFHQALEEYIKKYFENYKYMGDIHEQARLEYPKFVIDENGPQALQEICAGTAACHKDVTCQGWSSYFLVKLASDAEIDPVFTYTFMLADMRASMSKKRGNSGISKAMVTMLDVAKHIVDESEDLLDSQGKDIGACKKECMLDVMKTYLKNNIPESVSEGHHV